ncbi:hypothetical protein FOH10_21040 [Nocardia otitidiscaviarum]|uniref:DUF8020 domain-containing protein n=1 Tax=Nocardia otitidiscaviarum TaxID=1823 RepID=A0A516NPK9_9NOCA|nr:hypothetical protein [Nocardia otitidiscaviarum]MCP9623886.1 hypothetical protein [Nocardia otitidiscaviarum]QDP80824.1 hypothetical protein FOH10_21040 [Nocardia otitidiscaviarum]
MKFTKVAATSALVIAALGIATGTSYAQPAPAPAPAPAPGVIPSLLDGINQGVNSVLPAINWSTHLEGDSIVLETSAGSLTTDNGQFAVRDNAGNIVTAFPLSYTLNDLQYPIDAAVDGLRATLTPSKDAADARPVGMVKPVVKQEAFDDAVSAAATQFGIITSIGTLVGTIVGGGAGCAIGGIGGLVLGIPVLDLGGATGIAGCLAGAAIGIPLGAAAGLVLTGVPAAIIVGIGFHNRINAPENQ